jgi:hypothetical protein
MPDEPQNPVENATITQAGPFGSLFDDSEDLLGDQILFQDEFVDDEPVDAVPATDDTAARLAKLETAARELAAAEMTREGRRLKRKVAAATTGAGATGFLPLLLQLLGVYDVDPAIAATLSTVASLIGAFAAGWVTPERTPPLPAASAHSLLELGSD